MNEKEMNEIGRDTHGDKIYAEDIWTYIYEHITNLEDENVIQRFTRLAETVVFVVQRDFDHWHAYVTENITKRDDVLWMRKVCQDALAFSFQDYETDRIEII